MKQFLSDRINAMEALATLAMAAKTGELEAEDKDIIGLSLGGSNFNVPDFIKEAAKEAIDQNCSKYAPIDRYLELREAITAKLLRDNGLNYRPNQIVVSAGAKQCLANAALTMLNPDDEVILPAPCWVSYKEIAKLADTTPVEVLATIEDNFKITPAQLGAAITKRTKMVWFDSPCNSTGSVYSQQELEALVKVLRQRPNTFILSDKVYEYVNFTSIPHTSFVIIEGMCERTITINGLSKIFAMTGWRIGYLATPKWIVKACNKVQEQITSGTNVIAQRAAIAALKAPKSEIQYAIDEFKRRRDLVLALLSEVEGLGVNVPEVAFYVFPDVLSFFGEALKGRTIRNAGDFSLYLLEEAMVATVTGEAFGDVSCIRISYAASKKGLREAIRHIKEGLA